MLACITSLVFSLIWLIFEIKRHCEIGDKLEVGTVMWVVLSIYILAIKIKEVLKEYEN